VRARCTPAAATGSPISWSATSTWRPHENDVLGPQTGKLLKGWVFAHPRIETTEKTCWRAAKPMGRMVRRSPAAKQHFRCRKKVLHMGGSYPRAPPTWEPSGGPAGPPGSTHILGSRAPAPEKDGVQRFQGSRRDANGSWERPVRTIVPVTGDASKV